MKNQELEKGILELAQKRMFTMKIVDSDAFLEMPLSTQCLYFHLNMRADDDGFIGNTKRIIRRKNTKSINKIVIFIICFPFYGTVQKVDPEESVL